MACYCSWSSRQAKTHTSSRIRDSGSFSVPPSAKSAIGVGIRPQALSMVAERWGDVQEDWRRTIQ